jgi:nuclear pore complex protein Nup54
MSIFGKPSGSVFGSQIQQQQPVQSIFGASTAAPQQQAPQLPALAQSQAQLASSLWQPAKESPRTYRTHRQPLQLENVLIRFTTDQKPITQQIQEVVDKWEPNHPNCVFKHYFYNKVDEGQVPYYTPGPNEVSREWEEALQKKPAPGYIPVLCAGYPMLAERLKTQKRAIADYNTRLHQINSGLDAILSHHELATTVRAEQARRRHTVLQERCVGLAAKVQVLRNRGYALSGDEDELRIKLKSLETSIQDPALSAREEELWTRLIRVRDYASRLMEETDKLSVKEDEGLDEETEAKAKKVCHIFLLIL